MKEVQGIVERSGGSPTRESTSSGRDLPGPRRVAEMEHPRPRHGDRQEEEREEDEGLAPEGAAR